MPLPQHPLATTTTTPNASRQPTGALHPKWISRAQAAALLGVSEDQIKLWVRRGELRASRPSPQVVRIDRQSIDAMLERHVEEYPTSAATPPHELAV